MLDHLAQWVVDEAQDKLGEKGLEQVSCGCGCHSHVVPVVSFSDRVFEPAAVQKRKERKEKRKVSAQRFMCVLQPATRFGTFFKCFSSGLAAVG